MQTTTFMTELPPELIIAVVDDDRRILEALGSLLESADFAVRLFDSATAMLESRCLDQIACLISDIDMPVMDGFEATRAIRKLEDSTGDRIPIHALTSFTLPADQERCLQCGMDGYLTKPIHSRQVANLVYSVAHANRTLDGDLLQNVG